MIRKIVLTAIFTLMFSVICGANAFASEDVVVSGNTITFTIDETGCGGGKAVNVYFTFNGAKTDVRGSTSANYTPKSNHVSGKFYDMSVAIPAAAYYPSPQYYAMTQEGRKLTPFCDSVSFSYTLSGGRLKAVVTIVNPVPELTGMCFVKRSSSGKDTYYDRIAGGDKDISDYVARACSGDDDETDSDEDTESGDGTDSGDDKGSDQSETGIGEGEGESQQESTAASGEEGAAGEEFEAPEEDSRSAEEKEKKKSIIDEIRERIKKKEKETSKIEDTLIPCKKLAELVGLKKR